MWHGSRVIFIFSATWDAIVTSHKLAWQCITRVSPWTQRNFETNVETFISKAYYSTTLHALKIAQLLYLCETESEWIEHTMTVLSQNQLPRLATAMTGN